MSVYRTFPYRYLGYGFPVAEALFFSLDEQHGAVDLCYTVGLGFVFGHVASDTIMAIRTEGMGVIGVLGTFVASYLWELLASVFIPSIIVHKICSLCVKALGDKSGNVSTGIGILSIPLFSVPLDELVDGAIFLITPLNVSRCILRTLNTIKAPLVAAA